MGAAFGAVGDHVIWGTWRPFCAVMALSVGLLVGYPSMPHGGSQPSIFYAPGAVLCAKWWIVGFLSMFNSIHIWIRWRGLQKGVSDGPLVVRWVESLHLQKWAAQIRRMGLLFVFTMVLVYFSHWAASEMLIWMVAVLLGQRDFEAVGMSTFVIVLSRLRRVGGDDGARDSLAMTEKAFTVKNRLGLHARPAALCVQTTNKFKCSVKVRKGDQEVDGKSIMGLMMLAAEEGSDALSFAPTGPMKMMRWRSLEKLFNDRFGEKD